MPLARARWPCRLILAIVKTSAACLNRLTRLSAGSMRWSENAEIVGEPRSILDADDAHLTAVFRTNVIGNFFCVSEAERLMSTQRGGLGGSNVNMSSAAARHGGQALLDKIGPTLPIGRAGTVEELAQVVAFLAGPLSSYMHGALVDVSGGR